MHPAVTCPQFTPENCRRLWLHVLLWVSCELYCYTLHVCNWCVIICMCGCRWQSIFHLRIWGSLAQFWNKVFLTMIIILIVLFLGEWKQQVCQVFSYSLVDTVGNDSNLERWPTHWPLEIVWTVAFRNSNTELGGKVGDLLYYMILLQNRTM